MGRALWLLFCLLPIFSILYCSKDHSLPSKFHENRIGIPQDLAASFEGDDVILGWSMSDTAAVFYYIVTVTEGTSGVERQYTTPGAGQSYIVEFAWIDSFYTFQVQAVDNTNFAGQKSNVDTVFITQ